MTVASDWRPLIQETLSEVWPDLPNGPRWIEAQIRQESGGDPKAKSAHGAMGLLQLMPGTAAEMGVADPFNPRENLRGGVKYLLIQYDHLPEILMDADRLSWSFAAYNGGRGYVNAALRIAKEEAGKFWWTWAVGHYWLMHRGCRAGGLFPDHLQMWGYVAGINRFYQGVA